MASVISKDTFTPFLKDLQKRTNATGIKSFLNQQVVFMYQNEQDMFRTQTFMSPMGEVGWKNLAPSTVDRRTRQKTFRGMSNSILKETYQLSIDIMKKIRTRSWSGGGSVSLSAGSGKSGRLAGIHQSGNLAKNLPARPVYSWLRKYQDIVFLRFVKYVWR